MSNLLPFLRSQGVLRLTDLENPWKHLHPEAFRESPPGAASAAGGAAESSAWTPVSREELLARSLQNEDGPAVDLDRLFFVTDAGFGKSVNLEWFVAEWNRRGSFLAAADGQESGAAPVAFLIQLGDLKVPKEQFLSVELVQKLQACLENGRLESADAAECLHRLRRQARLILAFDGLDQVDDRSQAVTTLRDLLDDPNWHACRFVVAGRPHAIRRNRESDKSIFGEIARNRPWHFVRLQGFTEAEATRYLGPAGDGRPRYELLPPEAREIAHTPRVARYLWKLTDDEFSQIQTRSDVYWRALHHMAYEALRNSPPARMLGAPPGSSEPLPDLAECAALALQLLGAMAFVMLTIPPVDSGERYDAADPSRPAAPNFNRLDDNEGIERLKEAVYQRFPRHYGGPGGWSTFQRDLGCLRAMNDALEQGIVDAPGMQPIIWRNPSLQEFLAAYWLSWRGTDEDVRYLADRIYLPYDSAHQDCYWVWRFAAEMPYMACDQGHWVRAMASLYQPANPGSTPPRRSCELIQRSFEHLERLRNRQRHPAATRVLDDFQGEFARIRRGDFGPEQQTAARDFIEQFREVPAGSFRMGTPPEKQGMSEPEREFWRQTLAAAHAQLETREQLESLVDQLLESLYPAPTRDAKRWRQEARDWWLGVFANQNLAAIERRSYPLDETPADDSRTPEFKKPFLLNRYPTLNRWYRLFDPSHGQQPHHAEIYSRVSGSDEQPAIFVSWYDAWVFCRWACWDGQACRLPHEDEWEYAAKAGTNGDQLRWWPDDEDRLAECCTFDLDFDKGSTTPPRGFDPADAVYQGGQQKPDRDHRNPWGFVDMLGNVWEWTEDLYRRQYTHADQPPESSARVCRGGSWRSPREYVRSGVRDHALPTRVNFVVGFRVARALP